MSKRQTRPVEKNALMAGLVYPPLTSTQERRASFFVPGVDYIWLLEFAILMNILNMYVDIDPRF